MTRAAIIAQARAADREKEALTRLGLRAVSGFERRVRVAALKAWRAGGNINAAMLTEINTIEPVIVDAMTAAHLRGRLTAMVNARDVIGKGVALATPHDAAKAFMQKRLNLSDGQVRTLANEYGRTAATVTGNLRGHLEDKVSKAVADAIARGVHTREGAQMIRRAFDAAGVTPANSFTAEAIFRTQTQIAYSAGRWQMNQDPAIDEELWGYEYTSVMDDRTTEICEKLDGVRRRKNDPFWQTYSNPNHWGCRGAMIEIWKGDAEAKSSRVPKSLPEPGEGFDVNFGEAFNDVLGRAA